MQNVKLIYESSYTSVVSSPGVRSTARYIAVIFSFSWSFRVHENALMVLIIDNQRGIHFYQIRQLPYSTRGARAHNLVVHLPFHMDCFFLSINR